MSLLSWLSNSAIQHSLCFHHDIDRVAHTAFGVALLNVTQDTLGIVLGLFALAWSCVGDVNLLSLGKTQRINIYKAISGDSSPFGLAQEV